MMLGMIRQVIVPLLLVGAMSAQGSQSLRIGIVFPESLTEKASMTYLRRDAVPRNGRRYYGVTFRADHSFVEVPGTTERFTALVWAPGCKMKHFDVPVEKSKHHAAIRLRLSQYGPIPRTSEGNGDWKLCRNLGFLYVNGDLHMA